VERVDVNPVALLLAISALCLGALATKAVAEVQTYDSNKSFDELTSAEKTAAKVAARHKKLEKLRVCADPGNMPLSSAKGEGYQNKIIDVLARAMDTKVEYFWRPYFEQGLAREVFVKDQCDILLDFPADYEGLLTTTPIYRSTYVFATREDSNIRIKDFDDPQLKALRLGAFQHSGMRLALAEHGVINNDQVHILSHRADLAPEEQPWRQVQEVIDGKLDIAAVWGPFAGWLKTVKGEPLSIQPVNLMDDKMQLEFSLAYAMPKNSVVLKYMLDDALDRSRDEIKQILTDYGVPLVQCSNCVVTGDIPSHGSYFTQQQEKVRQLYLEALPAERTTLNKSQATPDQIVTQERVDEWLKEGADLTQELSNAVVASDQARVLALLDKGADVNKRNPQGYAPMHVAARQRDSNMIELLVQRGADVNAKDSDGWTALLHAAFRNHVPSIEVLVKAGADLDESAPGGYTPLAIAIEEGKFFAAKALIDSGAKVDARLGKNDLTPLMVVASKPQVERRAQSVNQGPSTVEIAKLLIGKGADVNARSKAGVTPLMVAATYDNAVLAGVLIQSGADVGAKTAAGRTALDIAKSNHNAAAKQQIEILMGAKAKGGHPQTNAAPAATEPNAGQ
jgi:quinoprotein dehydrogenase-associated probable ABC transporter substrate-binding protein